MDSQTSASKFDRRSFLAGSSILAGGLLLPGLSQAAEATSQVLSIGYLEGSDQWEGFRVLPWDPLEDDRRPLDKSREASVRAATIVPADAIAGDAGLAGRWIAVRIHRLYPGLPLADTRSFRSISLIHWHDFGALSPAIVWGGRRDPGRSQGAVVSYPYLLRSDAALRLTLEVNSRGKGGRNVQTNFEGVISSTLPGPQLRRGVYLLGLYPGMWNRPGTLLPPDDPLADALCSLVISIDPLEV